MTLKWTDELIISNKLNISFLWLKLRTRFGSAAIGAINKDRFLQCTIPTQCYRNICLIIRSAVTVDLVFVELVFGSLKRAYLTFRKRQLSIAKLGKLKKLKSCIQDFKKACAISMRRYIHKFPKTVFIFATFINEHKWAISKFRIAGFLQM